MPGVGADPAATRLDDQHAGLGADHRRALGEDQLDQRRVLAEPRPRARALAPRLDVGEARDPALGLGDDLLRDDDDVAVATRRPRSAISAPSGVPRPGPRAGRAPRSDRRSAARMPGRSPIPSAAAVRGARSRSVSSDSSSRARRCRPGCRGRLRATRCARRRTGARPRARAATWRSQLPGPNAGAIASGGDSTSALVPVPWRSGMIARERSGTPRQQARRARAGRAAGSRPAAARRSRRRAPARARCRAARPRSGRRRAGRRRTRRPSSRRDRAAAGLAGDDERPLDAARRGDAPRGRRASIASASAARCVGGEHVAEPLLGGAEALHRQDRRRAHRVLSELRARTRASARPASRRPAASSISVGHGE